MKGYNKLLSRLVDYSLFALIAQSVASVLMPFVDLWVYAVGIVCIPLLYIPFEAIQLYFFQTTLGKALFGMKVQDEGKGKLSWKGAFKAALSVFKKNSRFSLVPRGKGKLLTTVLTALLLGGLTINNFFIPTSFSGSTVALTDGWMRFVSKEGKFSVDMPTKPEFRMGEFPVPPAGITLALSDYTAKVEGSDNEAYSVNYATLPRAWLVASSKKILFGAMYLKFETQLGSDVISKKLVTHLDRFAALDFVAKQNGQRIEGRLVLAGNRLYQISKSSPMSSTPAAKATADGKKSPEENFILSFNPLR